MVVPSHARFSSNVMEEKKVGWDEFDELMEGLKGIIGAEGMEEVERVLERGGGGLKVDFKEGW